jgi:hypothetical protein
VNITTRRNRQSVDGRRSRQTAEVKNRIYDCLTRAVICCQTTARSRNYLCELSFIVDSKRSLERLKKSWGERGDELATTSSVGRRRLESKNCRNRSKLLNGRSLDSRYRYEGMLVMLHYLSPLEEQLVPALFFKNADAMANWIACAVRNGVMPLRCI